MVFARPVFRARSPGPTSALSLAPGRVSVASPLLLLFILIRHPFRPTHWQFVALRDLEAGEELTICYTVPSLGRAERRQALASHYGFRCACPRCQAPAGASTSESPCLDDNDSDNVSGSEGAATDKPSAAAGPVQGSAEVPWGGFRARGDAFVRRHVHHTLAVSQGTVGRGRDLLNLGPILDLGSPDGGTPWEVLESQMLLIECGGLLVPGRPAASLPAGDGARAAVPGPEYVCNLCRKAVLPLDTLREAAEHS